jgi:DNA-binding SARP family transcriptional activator
MRILLASLLIGYPQPVTVERLADEIWAESQPRRPHRVLSTYVSRVRGLLDDTDTAIDFHGGGYQLVAGPHRIDMQVFQERSKEAATAFEHGDNRKALQSVTTALSLWRGAPFADVAPFSPAQLRADHLMEVRLNALDIKVQSMMLESVAASHFEAIGPLVAELRQVLAEVPLRERTWALLIQALYLAGRPAEAVQAYFQCRTILLDELGLEPGPELRSLYQEILTDSFNAEALFRRPLSA